MLKEAVVVAHRAELVGAQVGKGCIRYTKPEKLDFAVIQRYSSPRAKSPETAC